MIGSINFALSNRCTGNCVFCPASRGRRGSPKDMPLDLAQKIIDEASSANFPFKVGAFQASENGDGLLNPQFLEILRYIRAKFPNGWICIFTNFYLLMRDLSEVILKENLINHFACNIDGHDAESYYAQKHLPLKEVVQNIQDFVELRKELESKAKLDIYVLTLQDYAKAVVRNFGRPPSRLRDQGLWPLSSYDKVVTRWKTLSERGDVSFFHVIPFGWAERAYVDPNEDQSNYECPNLKRLEEEAWIAPNGDWYACCYDDQQQITYGNLNEKTLVELHESDKRKILLEMLRKRFFKEIGPPCNTVRACQRLE